MIHKDSIAGILLLGLAAGYYWLTLKIPSSSLSDEVGADGLPLLLVGALGIIATILVIKGVFAGAAVATVPEPDDADHESAGLLRALGFVAIGVGYMVIAPLIGFALGIAALIIAVALYEREPPSLKLMLVALTAGGGFWLVFVRFLGAEQPASSLLALLMKT
jgi:putative tricarboxylic transport membrane protein